MEQLYALEVMLRRHDVLSSITPLLLLLLKQPVGQSSAISDAEQFETSSCVDERQG
jgi:hypothetical protein